MFDNASDAKPHVRPSLNTSQNTKECFNIHTSNPRIPIVWSKLFTYANCGYLLSSCWDPPMNMPWNSIQTKLECVPKCLRSPFLNGIISIFYFNERCICIIGSINFDLNHWELNDGLSVVLTAWCLSLLALTTFTNTEQKCVLDVNLRCSFVKRNIEELLDSYWSGEIFWQCP